MKTTINPHNMVGKVTATALAAQGANPRMWRRLLLSTPIANIITSIK